jgi:RNA polymerase sigma factor (sigma-70 family)
MAQSKIHPDQMYIEGLAANDSVIIQTIYKKFVPKVVFFIMNNSGDKEHAQDVVQEVMILLFNQAKANKLQLTCPFDAYFFLLCKRKWLNELKKTSNKGVTIIEDVVSMNESALELIGQTEEFDEKQQLFDTMFQKLGDKCQELLKLSFTIKTM